MNAPNQSIVHTLCPVAVGTTGVTWGAEYLPFRGPPPGGFTRAKLAPLCAVSHGHLKRLEKRSPDLAQGRVPENRRVLRYSVSAVVNYLLADGIRVDLRTALHLGFPLSALPPDQFGFRRRGDQLAAGARVRLLPVPADVVSAVQRGWETWQSVHCPAPEVSSLLPKDCVSALDPAKACALAVLAEATPSRAQLAKWAGMAGAHSASQLGYLVADVARCLRDRLKTSEGQLLFALLLLPAKGSVPDQY